MVSIRTLLTFLNWAIIIVSTFLFLAVASQECKNPLLILMKIASGVDITKWDFLPIGGSSSNEGYEGFRENVFEFTCNATTKWHDDWFPNDITLYNLPDQFKDSLEIGDFYKDRDRYSIAHNELEAKESRIDLDRDTSLEYDPNEYDYVPLYPMRWLLSQNRKHQSLLKQYFQSGKIFAQISKETASTKFQLLSWLYDTLTLANDFLEFITQKLPPKYEDNPAIYQQLLQRFGTHFIHFGKFGYIHTLQFGLNQQYAIEHSDEQIRRNLRVAFYRAFNISKFDGKDILENETDQSVAQVDEEFAKNSELILSYGERDTSKWVDKVSGETVLTNKKPDRVLLYSEFRGLDHIIENKTIRSQVRIAIRMYMIKAYLSELKNVYNYTNYQLSREERASLFQVETRLNANAYRNMNETEQIIDDLYDKIPMFTDKKLCYPTLYDFYVTANLKLSFANNICAHSKFVHGHFTRQCVSEQIVEEQEKVNEIFGLYENGKQGQNCVKIIRELNLEFGLLNDRDNGLGASCTTKC